MYWYFKVHVSWNILCIISFLSSSVSAELDVEYIDQVLLSLRVGPLQNTESDSKDEEFLQIILPLYKTLEDQHDKKKIHGIGVCDLDKEKLQPLYESAKVNLTI